MKLRPFRVATLAIVLSWSLGVSAAEASEPPRLVVEEEQGTHRLWVELAGPPPARVLLRESSRKLMPLDAGWDPAGRAAFARWLEEGHGAWFAYGREGGRSWSEARAFEGTVRLRYGPLRPGAPSPEVSEGLALPAGGRLFIVQFKTIGLPEWRQALREAGAEVHVYVPYNAHIVRLDPSRLERVRALDFVERVEPYHPAYRLEPELLDWIARGDPAEVKRLRVVALEWGPEAKERIAAAALALGGRVAALWPSGHVLELWLTPGQLGAVAAHDDVLWVDRWSPPETDMDLVREDSGANWLETSFGRCGQGVRGEVMDSGIEQTHQDFDGILMHTPASVASHGTSTYGIVFGNGARDGDGDAKGTGHMPCPGAQGIFADFDNVVDRFAHTQELKGAPYFASFQTNSWGSARTRSYNSFSFEMDDIIWRLDIAITQSQSNAGNQDSRPEAWAKNVISVGGIRHFDTLDTSDDAWNFGASIGPAEDGRIKPDLHYWYDSIYTTTTGNGYTSTFGGTSAATPEVAGVLGLMVQMWADNVWGTDPQGNTVFEKQPHFSTIKALLINHAQQYPFQGTNHDLTRTHQGWGRPSVRVAQERAPRSFVVDEEEPLVLGETVTYDVVVEAAESELKVTMVYPDPPGTTSSSLHRINDLDLQVTSPSGTVYHGNVGLDAGNYSVPGGAPNRVDTVENVFVASPEAGVWRVKVSAAEVNQDAHLDTPEDDVAFALVVTGAVLDAGVCGNGVREGREDCDGTDLGGATCASEGCSGGTLACNPDCTFDFASCTGCPTCDDDGVCEAFEDCASCPGDCRSGTTAACGNGICETADGEDCLSCPADCNGQQAGKPGGRFCCGDGTSGQNPVTCSDGRCTSGGFRCTNLPAPASCCGDGACEGDETTGNCEIDCGAPPDCGNAVCDPGENSCSCPGDCGPAPANEVSCTDGLDEDCDGLADCDDADCGTDPACACTLLPSGAACTFDSECCSGKCKGPSGRKTCR